jgi:hypothetical protein
MAQDLQTGYKEEASEELSMNIVLTLHRIPMGFTLKDNLRWMLVAPELWRELLGAAAEVRVVREIGKTGLQSVLVTVGLL